MAKLLDKYNAKRDFGKTPEPKGKVPKRKIGNSFVIQKHDATRLHYDFRLELDGVLKSWAVTRGPSLVPGEKRLAVQTEDHPLAYGGFEGTIPKGQYGGGTVMLWDRGVWEPQGDPHKGLAKGHLAFSLNGEKLHGAWHLVRLKKRPQDRNENWLLIKSDDEWARTMDDADILEELPLSVDTGRSLDEIATDRKGKIWQSNRESDPAPQPRPRQATARSTKAASTEKPVSAKKSVKKAAKATTTRPASKRRAAPRRGAADAVKKASLPDFVEPCLATLVDDAPSGKQWLHEIKWDGYRLLGFVQRGKARLKTRNDKDYTNKFPGIATALGALDVTSAIVDGEAIVEDGNGHSSFSALQAALSRDHSGIADHAIFYAFDLLHLDGADLRELPLEARKERLAALVPAGERGRLRLSEHIDADGQAMIRNACRLGMEGIISKRRDRPYRSGRGTDWLKTKCTARQEFVIAGFTPSTALKSAVGSLVLGYHEDGRLRHAGRTGTGFTADLARDLYRRLQPLKAKAPPFDEKLTALQRRGAVWVNPELVAEIEFRGWTGDDLVRHAAFKGLREDKQASEIVREEPKPVGAIAAGAGKAVRPVRERSSAKGSRSSRASNGRVAIAGVELTHPDRVLWEEQGLTKQGLAEFYEDIAEWILPHLVDRPLSLVRCPSGAQKGCFYQKHSWAGLPDVIRRDTLRDEAGEEEVLYIEDLEGLVALVQASVLEIHPWGAPIGDVERPDRLILDFDPGEGVTWPRIIEGAREARERLKAMGLTSFVKTTGGKGLHVVAPLTPKAGWDEVKGFARSLAETMERDNPSRYISTAAKRARHGKIYVDYLRNGRGATAVAAYSTRARARAPVATPISWEELSPALKPDQFTVENLSARLKRLRADPWRDLFKVKQTLPASSRVKRAAKALRPR